LQAWWARASLTLHCTCIPLLDFTKVMRNPELQEHEMMKDYRLEQTLFSSAGRTYRLGTPQNYLM